MFPRLARTSLAALAMFSAASGPVAAAPLRTVCTVTINSSDEKEVMQRQLPPDRYRIVELVQRGNPQWLDSACRSGVTCDALVISGHFDDGTEFYTEHFDRREFLTVHELERASCSASCRSLFSQLKEVYLFGCNTLKVAPRNVAAGEVVRSLLRSGRSPGEADRVAAALTDRYGESNRERLRSVFAGVPVLYGFSSWAPLGIYAGPLLERYFQQAPAFEVAAGTPSPTLLKLFAPNSMVAVPGQGAADPQAAHRQDMCRLADEAPTTASKLAFVHEVLRREPGEVRLFLDHLERYVASVPPVQRQLPDVAAAFESIEHDLAARGRFLHFARDADEAPVQMRMLALAKQLHWLTPAQEQTEFVQMLADRMADGRVGEHEVDLACESELSRVPGQAARLKATGRVQTGNVAHAAVMACLGDEAAHDRAVLALTNPDERQSAVAQAYLRHRPLRDAAEVRAVVARIAGLSAESAQTRALEVLARQRLDDPQSLQALAGLFEKARSLKVQRAIAGILIRADTRGLARAELARTLQRHRLKSPDGSDLIDVLIRLLKSA